MSYLGDFAEDGDLFHKFSTRAFDTGVPTTLIGSPVLSVYKDEGGAGTEKTTAESYFDLDVDHDSIAGWHNVRIDLSGDAFFETGADYAVVITVGTVGGVNVFGENIFTFSIENRSMGQPAGATLAADIAAIKAETVVIESQTDDIGAAGAGLTDLGGMSTGMKGEVESEANDALVAQKLDHLIAVADADDVADNSIIAHLAATTGDWSTFDDATDSLQAARDHATTIKSAVDGLQDLSAANVASELATYAGPTKTEMDTAHALLATPAQVNAQVVDALDTDTYAELAGVPAATSTLTDKIGWLFALARNKVKQTATTQTLRNDADGGNIAQATVSNDGTTATRNEFT